MTDRYTLPHSAAQAASIVAALNTLDDYPSRGVHVGRGRHVDIPDTWDGAEPCPPGWTRGHQPTAHPTEPTQLRVTLPSSTLERLADPAYRARCTAPQLALLDGLATIDTLPPDWIPAPEALP